MYLLVVSWWITMPKTVTITEFRAKAGPFFDTAIHDHQPLLIQRGVSDRGLLLGEAEAIAVLGDRRFNPEVMRSQGSVSVWLPEFACLRGGVVLHGSQGRPSE